MATARDSSKFLADGNNEKAKKKNRRAVHQHRCGETVSDYPSAKVHATEFRGADSIQVTARQSARTSGPRQFSAGNRSPAIPDPPDGLRPSSVRDCGGREGSANCGQQCQLVGNSSFRVAKRKSVCQSESFLRILIHGRASVVRTSDKVLVSGKKGMFFNMTTTDEPFFHRDGDVLHPTAHAAGPWNGASLNGRVITGILASELERLHGDPAFLPTRLTVDMQRAPGLVPLTIETSFVRDGRRIKLIDAQLVADGQVAARASCQFLLRTENPVGMAGMEKAGTRRDLTNCRPVNRRRTICSASGRCAG